MAIVALDAVLDLRGPDGDGQLAPGALLSYPRQRPAGGDGPANAPRLIVQVHATAAPESAMSHNLKVRERASGLRVIRVKVRLHRRVTFRSDLALKLMPVIVCLRSQP